MGYYSDTCSGPGSRRAGRGLGGPGGLNVEGTYMLLIIYLLEGIEHQWCATEIIYTGITQLYKKYT